MRLQLERIRNDADDGVLGVLRVPGAPRMFTMERPWQDNLPFVSCVPPGVYALEPHDSENRPDCWALVGGTVSHYPDPDCSRAAILIHVANRCGELQGCIAPGRKVGTIEGDLAVLHSAAAMADLRRLLTGSEPHELEIRWRSNP